MLRFNERVLNDEVIHTILVQKKDILKLIDLDINVPISILSTLKLKDGEFSLDDYMEFFDNSVKWLFLLFIKVNIIYIMGQK